MFCFFLFARVCWFHFGDAIFFSQFSYFLSLNCCLIHVFACKYKYEIMKIKHFDCFFHSIFIRALSLSLFHSLFFVTFVFSVDFFVVVVFKFNLSLKSFAYCMDVTVCVYACVSVYLIECSWIVFHLISLLNPDISSHIKLIRKHQMDFIST